VVIPNVPQIEKQLTDKVLAPVPKKGKQDERRES